MRQIGLEYHVVEFRFMPVAVVHKDGLWTIDFVREGLVAIVGNDAVDAFHARRKKLSHERIPGHWRCHERHSVGVRIRHVSRDGLPSETVRMLNVIHRFVVQLLVVFVDFGRMIVHDLAQDCYILQSDRCVDVGKI